MKNNDPQIKVKILIIVCLVFTAILIGVVIWQLIVINKLKKDASVYVRQPYSFVSSAQTNSACFKADSFLDFFTTEKICL